MGYETAYACERCEHVFDEKDLYDVPYNGRSVSVCGGCEYEIEKECEPEVHLSWNPCQCCGVYYQTGTDEFFCEECENSPHLKATLERLRKQYV